MNSPPKLFRLRSHVYQGLHFILLPLFNVLMEKYRKAEYVQRRVCFANVQSSLPKNVIFSVCARMYNAAYVKFIMWNSISGLDASYNFRCGVAVKVRSHQNNIR